MFVKSQSIFLCGSVVVWRFQIIAQQKMFSKLSPEGKSIPLCSLINLLQELAEIFYSQRSRDSEWLVIQSVTAMLPEIAQRFHCTKFLSQRWDEKNTKSGLKPVFIRKVLTLNRDWLWNFSFFLPFSALLLRSHHFDFFLGKWTHDSREVVELWFRKGAGIEDLWHKNRFNRCSSECPKAVKRRLKYLPTWHSSHELSSSVVVVDTADRRGQDTNYVYATKNALQRLLFLASFNQRWALISFLCDCSLVSCFTTPKFAAKPLFQNACSKAKYFQFCNRINNPRFTTNLNHLARLPISSLYLLKKLFFSSCTTFSHTFHNYHYYSNSNFVLIFCQCRARFNPMIRHGRVWEAKWGRNHYRSA